MGLPSGTLCIKKQNIDEEGVVILSSFEREGFSVVAEEQYCHLSISSSTLLIWLAGGILAAATATTTSSARRRPYQHTTTYVYSVPANLPDWRLPQLPRDDRRLHVELRRHQLCCS